VAMVARDFGEVIELYAPPPGRERKVRDDDAQAVLRRSETQLQRAASRNAARQPVVEDLGRLEPRQDAVRRLREARDLAVGLACPKRKAGALGDVLDLVDEARAQRAAVGL